MSLLRDQEGTQLLLVASVIIVIIAIFGIIFCLANKKPPTELAPPTASKQIFDGSSYNVYEFTDPTTYKRYLVFRTGTNGLFVVEAPLPVTALEKP